MIHASHALDALSWCCMLCGLPGTHPDIVLICQPVPPPPSDVEREERAEPDYSAITRSLSA